MNKGYLQSGSVEWGTPPDLRRFLNRQFGRLAFDPCRPGRTDGLTRKWGRRVFCNPPYGRGLGDWIDRAIAAVEDEESEVVCLLVPAATDTAWFFRARMQWSAVWFVHGRINFVPLAGQNAAGGNTRPSCVIWFHNNWVPDEPMRMLERHHLTGKWVLT